MAGIQASPKAKEKSVSKFKLALLRKLTLAPEARNQPPKGAYPAGRIKMYFDIFRANFSNMTMINLLTMIFAVPLIGFVCYVAIIGMEQFAYLLEGVKQAPYLLSGFGIGLSGGASLVETQATMLISYRVLFLGIAACMPILGFGVSGSLYIMTKLVWGEDFICKKDKYGNDVPRMVIEFFRGVKMYWKQTVIVMAVFGVIIAGVSNLIINFVGGLWLNNAGAGEWIGLIAACLISVVTLPVLFNLLPMIVSYKTTLPQKLKNAAILSLAFIIPTFILLALAAAPILLMLAGSFMQVIMALVLVSIGFSYMMLMCVNYGGYNSEKLLTPLYEMEQKDKERKKQQEQKAVKSQKANANGAQKKIKYKKNNG